METTTQIVTDYFAAPSDALAGLVLGEQDGPASPSRSSGQPLFDTVALPGIEPFVMLGTLHEALSGRTYGECTAEARHGQVVAGRDEGPWVVSVSDHLVRRLAGAAPALLADVAARWARSPELARVPPRDAAAAVVALAGLAQRARDARHGVYCWTRLP
jgi:hypothetical protein